MYKIIGSNFTLTDLIANFLAKDQNLCLISKDAAAYNDFIKLVGGRFYEKDDDKFCILNTVSLRQFEFLREREYVLIFDEMFYYTPGTYKQVILFSRKFKEFPFIIKKSDVRAISALRDAKIIGTKILSDIDKRRAPYLKIYPNRVMNYEVFNA